MRTEYCELALHAMLGSPTLLEGLSAFQTAFFLGSSSLRIDLRSEGDVAILSIIAAPGTGRNGRMLESVNADWLFMCASFFMGRVLPVTEIVTRDLRFARSSYVRSCTGARVRIGKATSLRFPKSCLAVRRVALPSASPMMDCIRFMHLKVGHFVAQSQADDPDLNGRTLRLESLAHREGVSVSTLRRRMEESHGGFRAFRQRELVNAAVDMLRASDATVDSIALDLGYADARSFRRFLKAALGKTPQEVRYTQDDDLAPYVSDGDVYRRITHIIAGIGDGVGAVT